MFSNNSCFESAKFVSQFFKRHRTKPNKMRCSFVLRLWTVLGLVKANHMVADALLLKKSLESEDKWMADHLRKEGYTVNEPHPHIHTS